MEKYFGKPNKQYFFKSHMNIIYMPQARNFYYRPIKCPMCQKELDKEEDNWFCSKECEEEWKALNGGIKKTKSKNIRGQDTSS